MNSKETKYVQDLKNKYVLQTNNIYPSNENCDYTEWLINIIKSLELKKEEILIDFIGIIQFDTKHETYEEDVEYYLKLTK